MVDIKFCGMTRAEDAAYAAALGARYVGVIFADGLRRLSMDEARAVLTSVPRTVARVGVFGTHSPTDVAAHASELELDVVQLHGDPDSRTIAEVRQRWSGQVWAVERISGSKLSASAVELFDVADAVVLDARVAGRLGGTGVALPWNALRHAVNSLRSRRARLVLAGGLAPENVAAAIDALRPDVVDVSSGVEAKPRIKDHDRMRAFSDAVAKATSEVHHA